MTSSLSDLPTGWQLATFHELDSTNAELKRILGSGMELLGEHYAYASLRIPDLWKQNNNVALRYVHSLMDQSGSVQLAWDLAIGDAWTLFAEADVSVGDKTQELSALEKASGEIGLKWNL